MFYSVGLFFRHLAAGSQYFTVIMSGLAEGRAPVEAAGEIPSVFPDGRTASDGYCYDADMLSSTS